MMVINLLMNKLGIYTLSDFDSILTAKHKFKYDGARNEKEVSISGSLLIHFGLGLITMPLYIALLCIVYPPHQLWMLCLLLRETWLFLRPKWF